LIALLGCARKSCLKILFRVAFLYLEALRTCEGEGGYQPMLALWAEMNVVVTTDFRQVLGEAVAKSIGSRNLDLVFPGAQLRLDRFLSLI
jgi:hypothetical protein